MEVMLDATVPEIQIPAKTLIPAAAAADEALSRASQSNPVILMDANPWVFAELATEFHLIKSAIEYREFIEI
jgi:hypothetical protein